MQRLRQRDKKKEKEKKKKKKDKNYSQPQDALRRAHETPITSAAPANDTYTEK